MNTLEMPQPSDLYLLNRQDINSGGTTPQELLNKLGFLEGEKSEGEKSEGEKPQPEEKFSEPFARKNEDRGLFQKTMELLDFLSGPLQAPSDAVLAPFAGNYKSETFAGQTREALSFSKEAFLRKLLPEFGEGDKAYGRQIAERIIPNGPASVKQSLGITLDVISDPSLSLGLPFLKVAQKGLKIAESQQRTLGSGPSFKGIFQEGLHEIFLYGKGVDPTDLGNLGKIAKKADQGDPKAIQELNDQIDANRKTLDAISDTDDADVVSQLSKADQVLGKATDPPFELVSPGREGAKVLIGETLDSNVSARELKLNFSRLNTSEEVEKVFKNLYTVFKNDFDKIAGGQSNSVTQAKAQKEQLTDLLARRVSEFTPSESYALRQILVSSGNQLVKLAKIASSVNSTKLDLVVFDRALSIHKMIQGKAIGVSAHAGRLLQSYNLVAKTGRGRLNEINDLITGMGETNSYKKRVLVELIQAAGRPEVVNQIIEKNIWEKTSDVMFEIFANSILSGPITHSVNITSNAFTAALSPSQTLLQGMSATSRGDFLNAKKNYYESFAKMQGVLQSIGDGVRFATSKDFRNNFKIPEELTQMHELAKQKISPAITSQNLGASGTLGAAIDFLGNMIRIPGNVLMSEDKVFKYLHYRMETNSQAMSAAFQSKQGEEKSKLIYNALRNNPDVDTSSKAIDLANYYTFTQKLGSRGTAVHKGILAIPGGRYLIPFFRTPTNIVKMGLRNTIFGNAAFDLKSVGQLTPEGDLARAKIATGTLLSGTIVASLGDNITGAVDKSTPSGRFAAEQGKPPYSIRVGETWVSYERLEPLRSIIGMYVNYREAISNIWLTDKETGEENPTYNDLFSTVITPGIQTVGDNYMLKTFGHVTYMLDGINSGNPEYAANQVRRTFSSMTVPAFLRQINTTYVDNTFRKADSYIDMVRAGIPGLSRSLPPRRTLWGDEQHVPSALGIDILSPIKTASVKYDKVDEEIIRVQASVPGEITEITPPGTGVTLKLTPRQTEKATFIRGKGPEGISLKSVVASVISSPQYTYMPDEIKKGRIEYLFNKATEHAKGYLLANDLELQYQLEKKIEARKQTLGRGL